MLNRFHHSALLLTAWTIFTLMTAAASAAEIAHYTFDNTFNDSSASMNHLTIANGAPGYTSTAGDFAFGGAGLYTTGDEWLALNSPVTFSAADPWTIAFWAKRRAGAENRSGMIVREQGTGVDFIFISPNQDGLRFRSSTSNTEDFNAPSDSVLRHFALVADGTGNLDLYIDGVFSETENGNTSFNVENVAHAFTATSGGGLNAVHSLDGNIDELFIFDEALNATQIGNLHAFNNVSGPAAVPEPSTWAIWILSAVALVAFGLTRRRV